ncbi:DUF3280 domain-containing protein [Roseovarius aestuariivivens]|uniref:DUF3280 domain-containing protein n=1 Tax=Roseovarius aestuariivivens TaxID=1888910 RepID=UPI0010803D9E|nr:DUF3280 domain-containing protein [Roseovarius aestuariivivens]
MRYLVFGLCLLLADPLHAGEKVAFFGMTKLDTSLQTKALGESPQEAMRLAMIEAIIVERFEKEGFEFVDLEPEREAIDRQVNLAKCYGCDSRIARRLGAQYSLVGEVQKVSNLILTMNLQLRDAESGVLVKGGVVDIRSNTDEGWSRGIRYILKNRIFRREE